MHKSAADKRADSHGNRHTEIDPVERSALHLHARLITIVVTVTRCLDCSVAFENQRILYVIRILDFFGSRLRRAMLIAFAHNAKITLIKISFTERVFQNFKTGPGLDPDLKSSSKLKQINLSLNVSLDH